MALFYFQLIENRKTTEKKIKKLQKKLDGTGVEIFLNDDETRKTLIVRVSSEAGKNIIKKVDNWGRPRKEVDIKSMLKYQEENQISNKKLCKLYNISEALFYREKKKFFNEENEKNN